MSGGGRGQQAGQQLVLAGVCLVGGHVSGVIILTAKKQHLGLLGQGRGGRQQAGEVSGV